MNRKQVGKFLISSILIKNADIERLAEVFAWMKFIPTRTEHLWQRDKFEYIGLSHMFREVDVGEMIPLYDIEVSTNGSGVVTEVKVVEKK